MRATKGRAPHPSAAVGFLEVFMDPLVVVMERTEKGKPQQCLCVLAVGPQVKDIAVCQGVCW